MALSSSPSSLSVTAPPTALVPTAAAAATGGSIAEEKGFFGWEDDVRSLSLRSAGPSMDAMSYVEASEAPVNELIEAEMAAMARVPVATEPEIPLRVGPMATAELARIDRGDELASLSIGRYACDEPERGLEKDASAWRRAVQNCAAQLEHQANRVVNLELAESFGEAAARRYVKDLERTKLQIQGLAALKKRDADAINLKRKLHQETIATDILRLEGDADEAFRRKHLQLRLAVAELREQVKNLQDAQKEHQEDPSPPDGAQTSAALGLTDGGTGLELSRG